MVYIPNCCSFSPISDSRLVIPLKHPSQKEGGEAEEKREEEEEEKKKTLFSPNKAFVISLQLLSFHKRASDLLQCAAVTEPGGRAGPQTLKPEEISVPCQATASADGTDAFSLLPVDSHSLIFHTKLPAAGLLILFYLSLWHLLLRPIKFDVRAHFWLKGALWFLR